MEQNTYYFVGIKGTRNFQAQSRKGKHHSEQIRQQEDDAQQQDAFRFLQKIPSYQTKRADDSNCKELLILQKNNEKFYQF